MPKRTAPPPLPESEAKRKLLNEKVNAFSLSHTKVAYSREGEADDTLVVRDVSKRTTFTSFGVRGVDKITDLFFTILAILRAHRNEILPALTVRHREAMESVLDGLSDDDMLEIDGVRGGGDDEDDDDDYGNNAVKINLGGVMVMLTLDGLPRRLVLFTMNAVDGGDKTGVKTGVYLFPSEAIKLVRHMNDCFHVSKSACLMPKKRMKSIKIYDHDDFFLDV